jgi:hypothetical protein
VLQAHEVGLPSRVGAHARAHLLSLWDQRATPLAPCGSGPQRPTVLALWAFSPG